MTVDPTIAPAMPPLQPARPEPGPSGSPNLAKPPAGSPTPDAPKNIFQKFRDWLLHVLWLDSLEDSRYMDDLKEAQLEFTQPLPHVCLVVIAAFTIVGIVWASLATVEEVTNGRGTVIPSGRIQTIQNLEGGILSELMVHEGQLVQKGEILIKLDDTGFSSTYRDAQAHSAALNAGIIRLTAEMDKIPLKFPPDLVENYPEIVRAETDLYESRKESLESSIKSLRETYSNALKEYRAMVAMVTRLSAEASGTQLDFPPELVAEEPLLIKAEIAVFKARQRKLIESVASLRRSLNFAQDELERNKPLVPKGVVSEVEVLRLERQVNDLRGRISEEENNFRTAVTLELTQKKSELLRLERQAHELNARLEDKLNQFTIAARQELKEKKSEQLRLDEAMVSSQDRVARTAVRSPVNGTVNKIQITTIGGVIRPGMDIMEIVPLDDNLVVEAQVKPTDIAFISPGQDAMVKVTAYDYSIYGGLKGKVTHISPDTIQDPGTKEPYYQVRVTTDKNYVTKGVKILPIKPGMTSTVDIITGQKTVLQYLMKPFIKAGQQALRER